MRNINSIVIHHSVTDQNNKDIWSESIDGRDYHPGYRIDGKEYKGNYHYLIYQDGEVKHPIDNDWYTYHCGNYDINLTSLAVCFVGNFEENEPSTESLISCRTIVEELKEKYKVASVYLHRDIFNTACPGKNINLEKINNASMKLTKEQVRRGYLAILRREPDKDGLTTYVGKEMSVDDFLCDLGDSKEHTKLYDDAMLWRNQLNPPPTQNNTAVYTLIDYPVYKKTK